MVFAIIPSMKELPEDCTWCAFNYDDMYCTALDKPESDELQFNGKRPASCTLFEVK